MSTAEIIAGAAVLMLLYAYVGYPVLLLVLTWLVREPQAVQLDALSCVTIVFAAWNEEAVIAHKLENALSQDYPPDLLDVVVVSDSSTDRTDAVVESYAKRTNRVQLLRAPSRQGKALALNAGVAAAKGSIVVLTDANAMFAPDAVSRLVRPFGDPRVGAVSGQLHYQDEAGVGTGESAYWRYEQLVKRAESALSALLGANGSIYAVRHELYRHLRSRDMDDFRVPYEVLLQGYRVLLEPKAKSFEPVAHGLWAEYRRKVRIMDRSISTVLSLSIVTIAKGRMFTLWQLVSHKVLREVQGVFFLAALGGAVWGAAEGNRWLLAFLAAQVCVYVVGVIGWVVPAAQQKPFRLAAYLDMIVLASIAALWRSLAGGVQPTWNPVRPKTHG